MRNTATTQHDLPCYTRDSIGRMGAGMGADCVLDKLTKRSKDLELLSELLVEIEAHSALFLLKNSFSIPKLTFLLRTSPCFMHPDKLSNYDSNLTSTLEKITNVQLTDSSRIRACLLVKMGGLGLPSASLLATSCFLFSASSCAALSDQISTCTGQTGDEETALELWGDTAQALPPNNRSTQKNWTWPVFKNLKTSMLENCSLTYHNRIDAYSERWREAVCRLCHHPTWA